jgi:transposase-like protein
MTSEIFAVNPLERIMGEIRRKTRVVGAFRDGQFCLNIAAAKLRHIARTLWSTTRYVNMWPLCQTEQAETEVNVA